METRSLNAAAAEINPPRRRRSRPVSAAERIWLARGAAQPDGRLPLFAPDGTPVPRALIEASIRKGLAERWFHNPLKPDWLVCRITDLGRSALDPS